MNLAPYAPNVLSFESPLLALCGSSLESGCPLFLFLFADEGLNFTEEMEGRTEHVGSSVSLVCFPRMG